MRIGFLSNQIDNRGTGNALYNYAHYNEEFLGNESVIYTFIEGNHDSEAIDKFEDRFGIIRFANKPIRYVDALYHIKSGFNDGFSPGVPYLVHAVFDNQPHGDRYATISPWMGERFGIPYVPHIVEVHLTEENLRDELGIPKDAIVFARYGGMDTFDIPFVWDSIRWALDTYPNVYFLFMNTNLALSHPRIITVPTTVDSYTKKKFINTSDAMLHARGRGETFGISVGEFAISGKPILTFGNSHEAAHLQELGHFALRYYDSESLNGQISKVVGGPLVSWGYGQYTAENVMQKFKEVFLD